MLPPECGTDIRSHADRGYGKAARAGGPRAAAPASGRRGSRRGRPRPPSPGRCARPRGRRAAGFRRASSRGGRPSSRRGAARRRPRRRSSGLCVTPTVGRPSTEPRWSASPAPRGWSRPVAFTSRTSGGAGSARTAASSSGPSRSASSPASYGAPASPGTAATVPPARGRPGPVAGPARPGRAARETHEATADHRSGLEAPRLRTRSPKLQLDADELLRRRRPAHAAQSSTNVP